jgi:hypothetical protein
MGASAWSSGLTHLVNLGTGIAVGVTTGNPVLAITGAMGFSGWLVEQYQKGASDPLPSKQPSVTVREQINSVSRFEGRSDWFQQAARQAPTRQSDEAIAWKRAAEIAQSPSRGTDFDNWIRAVIELKIAQRAAEIARSPNAGSNLQNWLRAERELKIAQRAEEIAQSFEQSTDCDNWVRAEHDVDIAQRAEKIAHSSQARDDKANWLRAERELAAEHLAIKQRAEAIARAPQTAIEIRTHADIMCRAEDIARSNPGGTDFDNWVRAEQRYAAFRADLDQRVQRIAASPEATRGHWSSAEKERRAEIMIRAEDIARSNPGGTDFDNWVRAEQQTKAYYARVDRYVQRIAASPEAALGHWLKAQQELIAEGRIPPR